MPELPEVETIKNELAPRITGLHFVGVDLLWEKAVHVPSPVEFCKHLAGQHIKECGRRGKYLLLRLSGESTLVVHLKMSGVLVLKPSHATYHKHTTAVFRLDDTAHLHFVDQRKFGTLWLVKDENEVIGKLGPEPLDALFTKAFLRRLSSQRRVPIKVLLCDQHAIAGIGNMYADEALFAARIHPQRSASALSDDEVARLHQSIVEVLEKGIKNKGASTDTYRRPGGETGGAHTEFNVAHRKAQTCPRCGAPIQRIALRGRGTYFCPECQLTNY